MCRLTAAARFREIEWTAKKSKPSSARTSIGEERSPFAILWFHSKQVFCFLNIMRFVFLIVRLPQTFFSFSNFLSERNGGDHFQIFDLSTHMLPLCVPIVESQDANKGDILVVSYFQHITYFPRIDIYDSAFKNRFTEVGHEPLERRSSQRRSATE